MGLLQVSVHNIATLQQNHMLFLPADAAVEQIVSSFNLLGRNSPRCFLQVREELAEPTRFLEPNQSPPSVFIILFLLPLFRPTSPADLPELIGIQGASAMCRAALSQYLD